MIKPSVVVCNPKDVLFPLWMQRMVRDRCLFDKVIVIMTQQADDRDYTDYIARNIPNVTMIQNYPYSGKDWRNEGIQNALHLITSTHILFLEQDFLVVDGFFEDLLKQEYDTIGFKEGNRFHPACLLVSQKALARTNRDFSTRRDVGDHFARVSIGLFETNWKDLNDLKLPRWYHLAGLTQNYRLTENFYQTQIFSQYNKLSIGLDQPESWRAFCVLKDEDVGHVSKHPLMSLEVFFGRDV